LGFDRFSYGKVGDKSVESFMNGKLLDTTVLIDLFRGNDDAAKFVETALESEIALFISVISAMELIAGCRNKKEVDKTSSLVADFTLIHLSPIAKAYELMWDYSNNKFPTLSVEVKILSRSKCRVRPTHHKLK
jgi:predicted nucleic acid-binding protein